MIELPYSLIIEATEEPDYFGFYSPDLEGFTGIGPPNNPDPRIIVQNEKKLAVA
ncbi:MAG: hypothetical protein JRJ62_16560 [Deltaproteobacteria bacterium]|nr:hypothetical protein [Deltaproteobacteria bacterium]